MTLLGTCLMVGAGLAAAAEVVLLNRQRRLFLSDQPQPCAEDMDPQRPSARGGRAKRTALLAATAWSGVGHITQPLALAGRRLVDSLSNSAQRAVEWGGRAPLHSADASADTVAAADARNGDGHTTQVEPAGSAVESEGAAAGPPKRNCHAARRVLNQLNAEPSKPSLRGRHAARSVLYWLSFEEPTQAAAAGTRTEALPQADDGVSGPPAVADDGETRTGATNSHAPPVEEAVVYVDAAGRVTFANPAARALLHWSGGALALSEVVAGGADESTALLSAVARQELVGQLVTLVTGPSPERLEISGLPFRDRDGNVWGAALFFRRAPGGPAPMDTR
jgi:PAS domain-containing protein